MFSTKILYLFLILPMCAADPTRLIFIDFISLIKIGEEYKSWSF
jgi:hypothetical protein